MFFAAKHLKQKRRLAYFFQTCSNFYFVLTARRLYMVQYLSPKLQKNKNTPVGLPNRRAWFSE